MGASLARRFSAVCLLALTASLSGCAGRLERPRLPDVFVDPPPNNASNGAYTLTSFNEDFTAYKAATQGPIPAEPTATALRNKMVYGVMAEIDYVYHDYEIALFMDQSNFKVATDVLQLGLGMASTITNGARAKTVLSAVLTGFTGTTLSIDKNFFRQQTVQALVSSMQAGRDRTKAIIVQRMNNETVSTYPFQAARSDLATYFFAGTLPAALQQLSQTAAAHAEVQRQALTGVTVENVAAAKALNAELATEFKDHKPAQTVNFLKAMGVAVDGSDPAKVEAAYRNLANEAIDNPVLMKKFMEEAKKAGLIK